ncbi:ferrochelatase [Angustibacter speluncae]
MPDADQVTPRHDVLVLLSFGGPEQPEDVVPFLRNVTRGKNIPDERLAEVGEHYYGFGGRSPINDQNKALLAALRAELAGRGVDLPVVWGNRNWEPYLTDALREAHEAGARRVLVLTTSAYSSYSGCRQYREDVARSLAELAEEGRELEVDQVQRYAGSTGFVQGNADAVRAALQRVTEQPSRLVFVTHSIPTAMADTAGPDGGAYVAQHEGVAARVADEVGADGWDLVYCSRSGPPTQPWLEPDVNDHLRDLHARGVRSVVLAPIGFVSDHMEVVYDLDTEAAATGEELGLQVVRAGTVGTDPAFVSSLVDLVLHRTGVAPAPAAALPGLPSVHDACPVGCCPNLRGEQPAACGASR